jgi:hypothetical protein
MRQRAAPAVAAVVFNEADPHGADRGGLQAPVDGGVDAVAGVLRARAKARADVLPRHFRYIGSFDVI